MSSDPTSLREGLLVEETSRRRTLSDPGGLGGTEFGGRGRKTPRRPPTSRFSWSQRLGQGHPWDNHREKNLYRHPDENPDGKTKVRNPRGVEDTLGLPGSHNGRLRSVTATRYQVQNKENGTLPYRRRQTQWKTLPTTHRDPREFLTEEQT